MSGSSSSSSFGAPSDSSSCERLRFEAQLTSPQPLVVATLVVGEVLAVTAVKMGIQVVVQVLKNGQPAGGLAGPDATRLRSCIEDGHVFKATVLSVIGGQVRVLVEHV